MSGCQDCGRPVGARCCLEGIDDRPPPPRTHRWGHCPCAACFSWPVRDEPGVRCSACTEAGCTDDERSCRVLVARDRAALAVAGPA